MWYICLLVQATLNARTAILAAANPLGGRYDRSKPLRHNVGMPPAILSRCALHLVTNLRFGCILWTLL